MMLGKKFPPKCFCSASSMASQTSGIIFYIDRFEIRKRYMRMAYESPVAKNLRVKANQTDAGILSRWLASTLDTLSSILFSKTSKSEDNIRLTFFKSPVSFAFKFF